MRLVITKVVHDSQQRVIKVRIGEVNHEASEICARLAAGTDTAIVVFGPNEFNVDFVQMATGRCFLRDRRDVPDGARLDNLPAAPLTMAVFGDSIAWGLGLKTVNKASSLLAARISGSNMGVGVKVLNLANAGATIGTDRTKDSSYRVTLDGAGENTLGEASDTSISVFSQMVAFANLSPPVPPESVDFVYLCAGINDVKVKRIVTVSRRDVEIKNDVDGTIGGRMAALIDKMLATFPNARILVAGYFPIVSDVSRPWTLDEIALSLTYLTRSSAWPRLLNAAASRNLVRNCATFSDRSAQVIGTVVDDVNALSPQRERVFFAAPDFRAHHVLFASRRGSHLWRLDGAGLSTDETRSARTSVCRATYGTSTNSRYCNLASVGHPDIRGAKLYFRALAKFV